MNGDEVEVRHGDKVVTLDERLEHLDEDIRVLKRLVYALLGLFTLHVLFPGLDIVGRLLGLIGL